MRVTLVIVGLVLIAVGVVWFLQGSGHMTGSVMSGSHFWEWVGVIAVVAGIVALGRGVFGSRARGESGT
jgi:hypothetical protein